MRSGAAELAVRSKRVRRVLLIVLVLNLAVLAAKLIVGLRTGSLAVLGAALESALDSLNNVVGAVIVTAAAREPDEEHPYGHEKFETVGTLVLVGFLSITCFQLIRESISQLISGAAQHSVPAGDIALLAGTGIFNLLVVSYERRRGLELGSSFLVADAEHTKADLFVTALAVLSLLLARFGVGAADPVLALIVAAIIARTGLRIARENLPFIVDERAVEADRIRNLIAAIPGVRSVHEVRSRSTASRLFAEVTVRVAGGTTVADAHRLADEVEDRIEAEFGPSNVTVHVEPA